MTTTPTDGYEKLGFARVKAKISRTVWQPLQSAARAVCGSAPSRRCGYTAKDGVTERCEKGFPFAFIKLTQAPPPANANTNSNPLPPMLDEWINPNLSPIKQDQCILTNSALGLPENRGVCVSVGFKPAKVAER